MNRKGGVTAIDGAMALIALQAPNGLLSPDF